jgi:hypothetical protein
MLERLCLYRVLNGKYVMAHSGAKRQSWATVLDSAEAVARYLPDNNDYLGPLEKLLLVEAGKRDRNINLYALIDLRTDGASDLARSVINASQVIDTVQLFEYVQRIEDSIENDPAQAIGSAKELVEAVGKLVLTSVEGTAEESLSLGQLLRSAFKSLKLSWKIFPIPSVVGRRCNAYSRAWSDR